MPSDSFADLWNSSAPSSSSAASTKPQTLASQSSASLSNSNSNLNGGGGGSRPGSRLDAFSLLAATTSSSSSSPKPSSQTGSRAITPSLASSKQALGTKGSNGGGAAGGAGAGSSSGSDAFSSLLGSTFAARKDASSSMSLADRQRSQTASALSAHSNSALKNGAAGDGGGVWDGLDMLGSSSSAETSTPKAHQHVEDEDDWGFGLGGSAPTPAAAKSAIAAKAPGIDEPQPRKATEDNELFDFLSSSDSRPSVQRSSPPQPQAPPQLDRSESPTFDPFEKFNSTPSLPQTTSTSVPRATAAAGHNFDNNNNDPGDFDFGDREYREREGADGRDYGADADDDDDEILGILGSKPSSSRKRGAEVDLDVNERPSPHRRSPLPTTSSTTGTRTSHTRTSSPPPHIIGQIVEMGFSPQQARVALAGTDSGVDVQLALEMLLSNGAAGSSSPVTAGRDASRQQGQQQREQREQRERERTRPRPSRHGSQRQEPERTRTRKTQTPSGGGSGTSGAGTGASGSDLTEKADKLLAQASELGMNVFSRAGALWKEGKARAQRVYEEGIAVNAAGGASGTSSPNSEAGAGAGRRRGAQVGEQQQQSGGGGGSGRPKWMTGEGEFGDELDELEHHASANGNGGFRDHDDDEDHAAVPTEPPMPPPRRQPKAKETETINLFGDDEPTTYVSPARRRGAAGAASSSSKSSTTHPPSAPSSQRQPPPPPPPHPQTRQTQQQQQQRHAPTPPTPSRPLITASPSSLAASNASKAKGTELFKLGRYAEAISAYTAALAPLPEGHLLRVPILNNRALARMRCGEYGGARGDCDEVLDILGADYRPENDFTNGSNHNNHKGRGGEAEGANVDLREGWLKARRRRAEASEARERWGEALKDWEVLAGCAWKGVGAGVRREALAGVGRCRKGLAVSAAASSSGEASKGTGTTSVSEDFDILVAPSPSAPQAPVTSSTTTNSSPSTNAKPKPKPIPLSPRAQHTIASAVAAARHASQLEEAEALARHSLKDRVDSRLHSWKSGKEGNLRALLATLDNVLWEELGWVRVGMHELVTERQVKVRYTRAIGKVHPDKLNAANTTLEQRMIANGVFGALNEAWVAHKG